jgi:hypothetical protein
MQERDSIQPTEDSETSTPGIADKTDNKTGSRHSTNTTASPQDSTQSRETDHSTMHTQTAQQAPINTDQAQQTTAHRKKKYKINIKIYLDKCRRSAII